MNNFLINFETNAILSGMVQFQAENETEAKNIAKIIIEKNLSLEDCLIELGTENNKKEKVQEKHNKREAKNDYNRNKTNASVTVIHK